MINILLAFIALNLASCVQDMGKLGHLAPYASLDGKPVARPIPENTISREAILQNQQTSPKLTFALLKRGQEQYEIFCAHCHGLAGYGNGIIIERGFPAPPSFHEKRLREMPDEHIISVIRDGFGRMYGFADKISMKDSFLILGYIRALELSQNVHLKDLPDSLRQSIERELK